MMAIRPSNVMNHHPHLKTNKNMVHHTELAIPIDLGFIGHQAETLQKLFAEYSATPNDMGYFLRFENYSELVINQGVMVHTNCFTDEEHFRDILLTRLLFNLNP
jgi:hypothetical protein